MTPEQWHRVKEVFEAALDRDSSQRAAFLDEACDGDVALRREAESLIESYEKEKSFMSLPVIAAAAQALLIEQAELRQEFSRVKRRQPWLEVPETYGESADSLDALIASLTARAAAQGSTRTPDRKQLAVTRREGWIHLPTDWPKL